MFQSNLCFNAEFLDSDFGNDPEYNGELEGKAKVFPKWAVDEIKNRCKLIVLSGKISRERIEAALSAKVGQKILAMFTIPQIQTRLKYQRLQYRQKKIKNY